MRYVTVVRPYNSSIRQRVFSLLNRARLAVREEDVIPEGTADDLVLDRLREKTPEILLIPFHAHRDEHGSGLNGIAFAERLAAALPNLTRVPILMPAPTLALPGARLKLWPQGAHPVSDELRTRILLLDESKLEEPETVAAVISHIQNAG